MRQLNPGVVARRAGREGGKVCCLSKERPRAPTKFQQNGCLKDPSHVFIVLQLNLARDFNPSSGLFSFSCEMSGVFALLV